MISLRIYIRIERPLKKQNVYALFALTSKRGNLSCIFVLVLIFSLLGQEREFSGRNTGCSVSHLA